MGDNDIDRLQSFGAKIAQENQQIPKKTIEQLKTREKNKVIKLNIIAFVNKKYGQVKRRFKHVHRKLSIKSNAFFSPYIIKIQTLSKKQKGSIQHTTIKRKRLIEKRKTLGNTIIVIRRWKNVSVNISPQGSDLFQHVYYFHKKNQKKQKYQPKKSIWDVPIINNTKK